MAPGFIIFFVLASGAFLVLWVLDLYLGGKSRVQQRRHKIKMLKQK